MEKSFDEKKKKALEIIESMAEEGWTYGEAHSVFRIASDELGNRRRNARIEKTPL